MTLPFKRSELLAAVDAGLVSRRVWADFAIYNYTARCAYERQWTPVTRAARGLVFHEPDGEPGKLLARPFEKFFNLGEMPETQHEALPWHEEPVVTEKLDGSLGIVFNDGIRWRIATRGSLESEQAVFAEQRLLPRYDMGGIDPDMTVLVEIIYPGNRIIVDYGDREELVLLAGIWRGLGLETHDPESLAEATGMALRRTMPFRSVEALEHAENSEGVVLHWPRRGLRVKMKSPEYVAAHRLLQYLSPKRILEMMEAGTLDDARSQLPEWRQREMDEIVHDLVRRLRSLRYRTAEGSRNLSYHEGLDPSQDRKSFAKMVNARFSKEVRPLLFAMADGKDIEPMLYKTIRKQLKEGD